MESAKYSPVAGDDDDDSVLPPSKPINRWRQFRPVLALYLLLSLAVGCYYYHHHYSDRQLGVTKIAVETESPIELLRESCELRFWSRHTQPYCERAIAEDSWLVAANIPPMPPLSVFQLSTPPRVSVKSTDEPQVKECEQQLMQHTFGWSYGKPFVGVLDCGFLEQLLRRA